MTAVQTGLYKHYKGQLYQVLHVARHSETEEWLVVYRALYGEAGIWVRPMEMFCESIDVDGIKQPRFRFESSDVPTDLLQALP